MKQSVTDFISEDTQANLARAYAEKIRDAIDDILNHASCVLTYQTFEDGFIPMLSEMGIDLSKLSELDE